MLSKPNQNTGPVIPVRPPVVSPELKLSIKLEQSKHRRTVPFKFSASTNLWIQAAVTVPHGNVQFASLAA